MVSFGEADVICWWVLWWGYGVWKIKVDSFIVGGVDGSAIYWKGMNQFGEENLDSTRHEIQIVLNTRESS